MSKIFEKKPMVKRYYEVKGRGCISFNVTETEKMYVKRTLLEGKLKLATISPEEHEKYTLELADLKREIRQYLEGEVKKCDTWVERGKFVKGPVIHSPASGVSYNYLIMVGTKFNFNEPLPGLIQELLNKYERLAKEGKTKKGMAYIELVELPVEDQEFIQKD